MVFSALDFLFNRNKNKVKSNERKLSKSKLSGHTYDSSTFSAGQLRNERRNSGNYYHQQVFTKSGNGNDEFYAIGNSHLSHDFGNNQTLNHSYRSYVDDGQHNYNTNTSNNNYYVPTTRSQAQLSTLASYDQQYHANRNYLPPAINVFGPQANDYYLPTDADRNNVACHDLLNGNGGFVVGGSKDGLVASNVRHPSKSADDNYPNTAYNLKSANYVDAHHATATANNKSFQNHQLYKKGAQTTKNNMNSSRSSNNNNNLSVSNNNKSNSFLLESSFDDHYLTSHQQQPMHLSYAATMSPYGVKSHRQALSSSQVVNNENLSTKYSSVVGSLKRIKASAASSSSSSATTAAMTAQQASYEAMRTIDLHLIRQIARNCMDFDLERKIDLEIKLRELAAQLLLEAQSDVDLLQVEKSLLASDQRMNFYTIQLEAQRKRLSNPSLSSDSGRGSRTNSHRRLRSIKTTNTSSSSPSADSCENLPTQNNNSTTTTSTGNNGKLCKTTVLDVTLSNAAATTNASLVSPPSSCQSIEQTATTTTSSSSPKSQSPNSPPLTMSPTTLSRRRSAASSLATTLTPEQRAKIKAHQMLINSITTQSNINCNVVSNNTADLCISEIRIPLLWNESDHFRNRGDYKRYAMFCLFKVNSQVFDTSLASQVDRQCTDVTFDDLIVFHGVEHDFELTLELYSCVYMEQFSLASTPRKIKQRLTSSLGKAMGRRLNSHTTSANYLKELEAHDKNYRFAKVATATLSLKDVSGDVKTYDLNLSNSNTYYKQKSNLNLHETDLNISSVSHADTHYSDKDLSKNTPPLFGHFCCKLSARPDVFDKNIKMGYLKVATIITEQACDDQENNNIDNNISGSRRKSKSSSPNSRTKNSAAICSSPKMSPSNLYWAVVCNFLLQLWPIDRRLSPVIKGKTKFPDPSFKPVLSISIDKFTRLLRVSNSSLTLETNEGCYILSEYTDPTGEDDMSSLLRSIEQYIYDGHIWANVLM